MNILLLDVDSKIPNLVLMKLSSYHKEKGDKVVLKKLNFKGYPNKNKNFYYYNDSYDKIYASIIFTFNKDLLHIKNCDNLEIGGTGYDYNIKLKDDIDNQKEDYSIYPENNTSYGFITRGCIRNCEFCFVPKKEGKLYLYKNIDQIYHSEYNNTKFLDNNILAYNQHENILNELIDKNIKCEFNQGLDIRLLNKSNAELLSKMNYSGLYTFAFDDIKNKSIIENKINLLNEYFNNWTVRFFIFVSPTYTTIENDIYRAEWCIQHNFLPYIMRHEDCYYNKNLKDFYVDIASYYNQYNLCKKLSFEEFLNKRHINNKTRVEKSLYIFKNKSIKNFKVNSNFFKK
jgi:hypothetical protein